MSPPILSIIIPTYNRPELVQRAVQSALTQTVEAVEVIVVDDGSPTPVTVPDQPRLRLVRLPHNRGIAAARNVGAKAAQGRWITYVDDDDWLLPHMAEVCLTALQQTHLPPPVAVLSGLEMVSPAGDIVQTRLPPTLPKGRHFSLEEIDPKFSFFSKQTLVVERDLLLQIGGYDEAFQSREHTELFLRLNPVCSILGLPTVTYRRRIHDGPRLSQDPSLRQGCFQQLVAKHRAAFESHPKMFADTVYKHALMSYKLGQWWPAWTHLLWVVKLHPPYLLQQVLLPRLKRWLLRPTQVWRTATKSS